MKMKIIWMLCLSLMTTSALASLSEDLPSTTVENLHQVEQAMDILEEKIGRPLTDEQVESILSASVNDNPSNYVEVASLEDMRTPKRKALYCVGISASALVRRAGAACVHIWSLSAYDMQIIGGGMAFELEVNVLRAVVTFDSSRYDRDFDPIPGSYGGLSMGATVGLGIDMMEADSGNKTLQIRGLNVGIGGDLFSINAIVIR